MFILQKGMIMKASEAIRKGIEISPNKCIGAFWLLDTITCEKSSCVIGAMADGYNIRGRRFMSIIQLLDTLAQASGLDTGTIASIMGKNDKTPMTREEIANELEADGN